MVELLIFNFLRRFVYEGKFFPVSKIRRSFVAFDDVSVTTLSKLSKKYSSWLKDKEFSSLELAYAHF